MATAGSIVIDLLMKTGSFVTDTQRAEKSMKSMERTAAGVSKGIVAGFTAIGSVIGGAIAAFASVDAAITGLSNAINAADRIDELSARFSISTETLSGWGYAAKMTGSDLEGLVGIIPKFSKNIADASKAGSDADKTFKALGISVKDQAGNLRSFEDLLPEVQNRFAGISNETTKTALAMQLFGKSGSEFLEFLSLGADGMRTMEERARTLGIVIDSDTAGAAAEFNDRLDDLRAATQGWFTQLASELLPTLTDLTTQLVEVAKEGGGVIRVMGGAVEVAMKTIQALDDLIQGLTIGMVGLAEAGKGVIGLDWDRIKIGWDVANNGADLAYYGRDKVGRDGRGATPAVPKVNFMDPADLLAQDKQAVEQLRQARAEADRLRKLAFGDAPMGGKGSKSRAGAVREEQDAVTKLMADYDALYGSGNEKAAGFIAQLEREIALHGDVSEAARVSYDIQTGAFGQLSEAQAELLRNLAAVKDAQDDYSALYGDGLQKMADDTMDKTSTMKTVTDQAARNMQDAFADFLFDPFSEGLGGMAFNFAKTLQKMAAQVAASKIFELVGGWANGYTGGGSGWINAIGRAIGGTSGGRAGGGPVAAGSMYRVGEGGRPELFDQGGKTYLIPGDAGSVRPITAGIPASSVAAGGASGNIFNTTVNITSDGTSTTQQGSGAQGQQLQQSLTQMMNRWAVDNMRPGGLFNRQGTR